MEVDPMIIVKKFNDVSELQKLQRIACSVPEDVYLHSMDDSIMVDLIAMECHDEALRRTPDPKSKSRRGWFDTSPAVFF